jgi:predicted phosphodiesterase
MPIKVFIDTEFTDSVDCHLISLGMAAETGENFYAEVPYPYEACSEFVRETVIPLLGKIPQVQCAFEELHTKVLEWVNIVRKGDDVEVCFDYQTDWNLFNKALDYQVPEWCKSRPRRQKYQQNFSLRFPQKKRTARAPCALRRTSQPLCVSRAVTCRKLISLSNFRFFMRLLILSDLHHELWKNSAPRIDRSLSRPDVVILAGDINTGSNAVEWAAHTFAGIPVLYVHGNHEAYGKNLEDVQKEIEAAAALTENVHFLNCGEYRINDVRFLGATLWTDFRLFGDGERRAAMRTAEAVMVDYKRIRLASKEYRKLRATDTAQFHAMHRSWLTQKLEEPFDGKTVVITHMAPSMRSVAEQYASDLASAAFASRLDDLANQADIWVHGHMHDSFDYQIGKCRVVCNPCGYMTRGGGVENEHFEPNCIIEIT